MEDKLPNIYINNQAKFINGNNKKVFYSLYDNYIEDNLNDIDVNKKIDDLIVFSKFIYKIDVILIMKDNTNLKKTIISKGNDYLLTIDNERIYISDIKDINTS